MITNAMNKDSDMPSVLGMQRASFMGLSPELWRLAAVLAIAQFSIGLWKWEYSVFLETIIEPWQMGIVFSTGTLLALVGSVISGTIADFVGRKWTLAFSFIPVFVGLIAMSYWPIWPFLPFQFGFIWFGAITARIMARAIPADEIALDNGRSPARRIMMVMMPLWFVDGISPLLGAFLLSSGYTSQDLHRIAASGAILAFIAAAVLVKESLGNQIIEKAKKGPVISFRQLGSDFWKLAVGMIGFYFFWNIAIQYLGNLSVVDWGVDKVTYGLTWSTFSLTSAFLMYGASELADRNLKSALLVAVAGNGLVFVVFGLGSGAPLMFLLNFLWALPFVVWIGAERSLIVLSVSEETKGRALGTYQFIMSSTSMIAAVFGALLWETSGNLRVVWILSGVGMLCTLLILVVVLKSLKITR